MNSSLWEWDGYIFLIEALLHIILPIEVNIPVIFFFTPYSNHQVH